MKELITEIEIAASAKEVWDTLTDLLGYQAWNPFITEADGRIEEGSRLKVHIEPRGGTAMTFKPVVTRVTPEREFRWLGRLVLPGLFDGEHIFEIHPAADGKVRFVQRETFRGILVPILWKSLAGSTQKGFEDMNTALKRRVESPGGGASGSW